MRKTRVPVCCMQRTRTIVRVHCALCEYDAQRTRTFANKSMIGCIQILSAGAKQNINFHFLMLCPHNVLCITHRHQIVYFETPLRMYVFMNQ